MNCVVLFGGPSCEHEVSIISGCQLLQLLKDDCFIPVYFSKDRRFYSGERAGELQLYRQFEKVERVLEEVTFVKEGDGVYLKFKSPFMRKIKVDVVFPILHGHIGEDGRIQGYFDTLGVPYCESSCESCAVVQNKSMMKKVLAYHDIDQVSWCDVYMEEVLLKPNQVIERIEKVTAPWIIKPAHGGSSIGIFFVDHQEDLLAVLMEALSFESHLIVEHRLSDFKEVNIACVGDRDDVMVSLSEQVNQHGGLLSYEDKYGQSGNKGMEGLRRKCPADLDDGMKEWLETVAKEAFKACECSGVVRIDFMIEGDHLYLNEINAIPGSLAMYLFKGLISRKELVDRCIEIAFERKKRESLETHSIESDILKQDFQFGIKK